MNRYFLVVLFVCGAVFSGIAQNVLNPNYAEASHPLVVKQITRTTNSLVFELALTNQIEKGYFCADKSVSISNKTTAFQANMLRSEGIPTCPDVHRFAQVGEVLNFQLTFPAVNKKLVYINLKENCNDNCFQVQGIVLDPRLNTEIDLAHRYFEEGKTDLAVGIYRKIVTERSDYPFAISYFNLIHFLVKQQNFTEAKQWYEQLKATHFPDTQSTLSRLRNMPYFIQLL